MSAPVNMLSMYDRSPTWTADPMDEDSTNTGGVRGRADSDTQETMQFENFPGFPADPQNDSVEAERTFDHVKSVVNSGSPDSIAQLSRRVPEDFVKNVQHMVNGTGKCLQRKIIHFNGTVSTPYLDGVALRNFGKAYGATTSEFPHHCISFVVQCGDFTAVRTENDVDIDALGLKTVDFVTFVLMMEDAERENRLFDLKTGVKAREHIGGMDVDMMDGHPDDPFKTPRKESFSKVKDGKKTGSAGRGSASTKRKRPSTSRRSRVSSDKVQKSRKGSPKKMAQSSEEEDRLEEIKEEAFGSEEQAFYASMNVPANGRTPGRKLITWHRDRMLEKLLLSLQYECQRAGIELPWDRAVARVSPGSSGNSALQMLAKARTTLLHEGFLVPPLPGKKGAACTWKRGDPIPPEDLRGYTMKVNTETGLVEGDSQNINELNAITFGQGYEDRREALPTGKNLGSGNYRRKQVAKSRTELVKADEQSSEDEADTHNYAHPVTEGGSSGAAERVAEHHQATERSGDSAPASARSTKRRGRASLANLDEDADHNEFVPETYDSELHKSPVKLRTSVRANNRPSYAEEIPKSDSDDSDADGLNVSTREEGGEDVTDRDGSETGVQRAFPAAGLENEQLPIGFTSSDDPFVTHAATHVNMTGPGPINGGRGRKRFTITLPSSISLAGVAAKDDKLDRNSSKVVESGGAMNYQGNQPERAVKADEDEEAEVDRKAGEHLETQLMATENKPNTSSVDTFVASATNCGTRTQTGEMDLTATPNRTGIKLANMQLSGNGAVYAPDMQSLQAGQLSIMAGFHNGPAYMNAEGALHVQMGLPNIETMSVDEIIRGPGDGNRGLEAMPWMDNNGGQDGYNFFEFAAPFSAMVSGSQPSDTTVNPLGDGEVNLGFGQVVDSSQRAYDGNISSGSDLQNEHGKDNVMSHYHVAYASWMSARGNGPNDFNARLDDYQQGI